MSQQIKVSITLHDGNTIGTFSSLRIEQRINNHHTFELRFPAEILEDRGVAVYEKAQGYLGKGIVFSLSQISEDHENHSSKFKGVITEVDLQKGNVDKSYIYFKGYSPTIILENGMAQVSYLEKNLSQIVRQTLSMVPENAVGKKISPANNQTQNYIVQFRETGHAFLNRLSAEFGEWYYFDGENIVFGQHPGGPEVKIRYNRDITEYSFSVRAIPLKFTALAHDYLNYQNYNSNSDQVQVSGLVQMGRHAAQVSDNLFAAAAIATAGISTKSKSELDSLVKVKKNAKASNLVSLKGSSDDPAVFLGRIIKVSATTYNNGNASEEDVGKFIVTSVVHQTDGIGNYSNFFSAIPSSVPAPPEIIVPKPVAESQTAVVKKNDDPEGMGRIQVQFPWQQGSDTTPWLRIVTPYSGKEKGFYFIPEVGEDVMVGFEHNNPETPFVFGALFQGKAKTDIYHKQNNKKGIETRSGNFIKFDDESGKEKIHILNKDGTNEIILSMEDDGKIKIKAKAKVEITAKKINLKGEEISLEASQKVNISANDEIAIKSKKIKIEASQDLEMKAMKSKIEASQELSAKSTQVKVEGSAQTSIKSGAKLELSGGAMATLKGGIVQIN